jgi:uncharacterized RDD family membrane protein YckC
MEYDDRITIATPEGVDLELLLGGLGSRFSSAIVDIIIQGLLLLATGLAFLLGVGGGLGTALYALAGFIIWFAYDVCFEVWNGGCTPGKRWNGLRVVVDDGRPITFTRSALRNIMRAIDYPLLIGAVVIILSKRNKRLGDMVAGTLVVREILVASAATKIVPQAPPVELPPWDVSAITGEELAAVRSFLERRTEITADARWQIAGMLAQKLRPKVAGADASLGDERFLDLLASVKAARL